MTQVKKRDARARHDARNIAQATSHDHVLLQALDVVLGSMFFRLNDLHLAKPPGKNRRGKRTRAKEQLYKHIHARICANYPRFNIGISTARPNGPSDSWKHHYRHWRFVLKQHRINKDYKSRKGGPGKA